MKVIYSILLFTLVLLGCSTDEQSNSDSNYLPTSWSGAQVISLCDSTDHKMAANELVREYEGRIYYNKKVTRSKNEINVSFDFISECCREFDVDYELKENQLIIVYNSKDGYVCECKCDYRGIVNVGNKKIDFNEIRRITIKKRI